MLLSNLDRAEQIDLIVKKFEKEKLEKEPRIHKDFLRRRLGSRLAKQGLKPKRQETSTLRNQPEAPKPEVKLYPPTLIDVIHVPNLDFFSYKGHSINRVISKINNFITAVYKNKEA